MNLIKILVVEDQKLVAKDIEIILKEWGYNVIGCAENKEEALHLFKTESPDIAIIDVNLNGEADGIDIVYEFNKIRPIPIVYLTAQADSQTVERAKLSRPVAYLLKPFDERSLQISLDLAFDIFGRTPQYQTIEKEQSTEEIKLNADTILHNNNSLFIKQGYRFVRIDKADMVLIEADRNHTSIFTKNHHYTVRMAFKSILERLQLDTVVRVHRSFAVNINHVKEFNDTEIVLLNGKSIPLSSAYKDDFLRNFNVT